MSHEILLLNVATKVSNYGARVELVAHRTILAMFTSVSRHNDQIGL